MDYKNVTFKQLFVTSFMLIMPIALCVTSRILSKYNEKNQIAAFLLMGAYALIYVILMYVVYTKMLVNTADDEASDKLVKSRVGAVIYVIRYAVRTVIIMYFFVNGCRLLMLSGYSDFVIAIPTFAVLIYFAGKGLKGFIAFNEVSFIGVVICLALFAICSFENADLGRLSGFALIGASSSLSYTICSVMSKGYLLLAGLCMLEFVVFIYFRIKERKRGMLVASVAIPLIFSIIASIFVVMLLGNAYHSVSGKSILNAVAAMAFPGGTNARLGLLACYLFVVSGITLMSVHVIGICRIIGGMCSEKYGAGSCRLRVIIILVLLMAYFLIRLIFSKTNAENGVIFYIAAIDVPLSVIVPAAVSRKKGNTKKYAATVISALMAVCFLTGCSDSSIESVDYLRVVFIRKDESGTCLTLVTDSLIGAASADESEEIIYSVKSGSLEKACESYNFVHDRTIDLSHVEYIVTDSWDTLEEFYPELTELFVTNYVEVICDENLYVGNDSENIREYISNHYEGECLAALVPSEK